MLLVTLYTTSVQAVRKTADDCRRMTALLDALGAVYETVLVDTAEMRTFVETLTMRVQLPLMCIGEVCLGTYDEVMDLVEDGVLPQKMRDAGYTEAVRGGEGIAVKAPPQKKTVVKKVVVVVKKKGSADSGNQDEGPSPPADEGASTGPSPPEGDTPPPPPEDDAPPPPPEDDAPPPPPDDDAPPPPPDDDAPPPPPDDDVPPPPPEDDAPPPPPEDDAPPPPPDDDVPPPPPE